jgi:signal peptidase I
MAENKNKFKETIDSIVVAFVIAMIIRAFCVQAYKIPSGSMLDTLLIGDHIIVNKLAYKFKEPDFQDIIVFEYPLDPSKDFIKRVVGCPGDKIKIENKKLYRNGKLINEKYVTHKDTSDFNISRNPRDYVNEFIVPKDYYFVMGDNRDSSFDSRYWGFVNKKLIKGEAWFIYWSWQFGNDFTIRFNRILKPIR